MKIYFDTNIYDFIADTNEVSDVRDFFSKHAHDIQASETNLFETYVIPDKDRCRNQLQVLTTIATSFGSKPQSWFQAMEVLKEIKNSRSQWLRKPISQERLVLSKYLIKRHLENWNRAKSLEIPLTSQFKVYRNDFEEGIHQLKGSQKEFRDSILINNTNVILASQKKSGQIEEHLKGDLTDPEFYWRTENLIIWHQALIRKNPASRDYLDWLSPFIIDDAFSSPTYTNFWMRSVRSHKVNKTRLSSLTSFYQLQKQITHGNGGDQIHACHLLDVDIFFTADVAFFHVLQQLSNHFSNCAEIILIDRKASSIMNQFQAIRKLHV